MSEPTNADLIAEARRQADYARLVDGRRSEAGYPPKPWDRDTLLAIRLGDRLDAAEAEIARLRICLAWERGMIARHEAAAAMGVDPLAASDYRNEAIRMGEAIAKPVP